MSQNYEMIYILRPDLSEEQANQAVTKYQDFLIKNGAVDIEVKVWGKRRLAYPIQKKLDGIYVQFNYKADGTQIEPLERIMRLEEDVLRYLTIKVEEDLTKQTSELDSNESNSEITEKQEEAEDIKSKASESEATETKIVELIDSEG
ncbi:30S ribosomal protein S6 [Candidatus Atelocyanobacterium thalassae]|uniref:Small ribosomal subunit protein bS6 n=1 Tax=cyanobacterium endosymbiont of Braarudosphaera bigelowii TaxID=1285375 RepID=A0ABM7U3Z7_9CHRO|nr:30S ribosomal protein S6 [Candidatus Atelocyanobacterium thalassa]BDA39326.1 30S ribosomal protein S6 [cyanobacterium endosymbiont of Braarudosphaera bigelowii]